MKDLETLERKKHECIMCERDIKQDIKTKFNRVAKPSKLLSEDNIKINPKSFYITLDSGIGLDTLNKLAKEFNTNNIKIHKAVYGVKIWVGT